MGHVFADDDADGAGGAAGGEPVAPANDEAREIADGATGEIVLATALGDGGAKFGELEGAHQRIESAAEPDRKKQPEVGKTRGDVAGGADDTGGDGVADGDGDAKTNAEDLEKRATFFARVSGSSVVSSGERVSGQWAVS